MRPARSTAKPRVAATDSATPALSRLMFLVILDNVDMRLEFCGEALRKVMHREDVDLITFNADVGKHAQAKLPARILRNHSPAFCAARRTRPCTVPSVNGEPSS
jgi:hypothetical protein